ncbi:flagellar motor switch protein FliN [Treponema sp. OMZ 840]|uniref:flagellar motor switch protein FliN n=1 Tax=Treponema sp. OMZ 840 TaxID=244313 RepID=UPI003D8C5539
MSDGAISQDEIDALLAGVDMGGGGSSSGSFPSPSLDTSILANFAAETVGTFANSLKTMTGAEFSVQKPVVEVLSRDDVLKNLPEMVVAVMSDFSAGLTGDHLFLLSPDLAKKITSLVNKEEAPELDEMALSVISEAIAQQVGTQITHLSTSGKLPGLASRPAEALHVPKAMVRFPQDTFPVFSYPVSVDGTEYTIWEAFSTEAASGIINALNPSVSSSASSAPGMLSPSELAGLGGMNAGGAMGMPGMDMGGTMNMGGGMNMGMPGMNIPNVQSVQYPSLQQTVSAMEQGNIGLIMDVYMEMTVELGRTKKQIKEILGMGEGTIIELDKLAGEPVDILVNHKPIAKGEVVVIDENFGVRVTEILSPIERVSDLR